ncbi:MAG: glycerophosphoryl diester phosphodiesterase membrane domain-containing protein [Planctomycetota bacterium]|nr:glycerophosphoryl diester phosphodiesterase membrane domain-containing protein [Planctomycetota bacterium]
MSHSDAANPRSGSLDRLQAVLRAAAHNFVRSRRRSLVYGTLYATLATIVLAPFFVWLEGHALALGGAPVATNVDIAWALASVPGVLALCVWSLGTGVVLLVGLGGQVVLAADAVSGAPRAPHAALRASLAAAPRLLGFALIRVVLYGLLVLPLGVTAAGTLRAALNGSDENLILQVVPAEPLGAALFYVGLLLTAVVAYVLLVRWSFVVHALVLEQRSLGAAMRRSAALVATRRWFVLRCALTLHAAILVAYALGALLVRALLGVTFDWLVVDSIALAVVAAALLLVGLTLASLVGAALVGAVCSSLATVLYGRLGGVVPTVPEELAHARTLLPGTRRGVLSLAGGLLVGGLALAWPHLRATLEASGRPIVVTAHRGSSAVAPENTLAAIRLALAEGADMCEIDVLEASDGAIVVVHDTHLGRLAGRDANVYDLTGAELTTIDVGGWKGAEYAGESVPLLRDVIGLVKGRMRLNIELKTHGHERDFPGSVVDLVNELDFAPECVITSLDVGMLRSVRARDPKLRLGAIVTAAIGDLRALDVDFYSVEQNRATPAFIAQSHAVGREVHVWTVNAEASITRMISRGADSLITDYPARAVAVRGRRGRSEELHGFLVRLFGRDL